MFMYANTPKACVSSKSPTLSNWEEDVNGVLIENCKEEVDPSGIRVVYCKDPLDVCVPDEKNYSIGASYLKNRLEKLRRAGFDAPMTKKAINMIDKQRLLRFR